MPLFNILDCYLTEDEAIEHIKEMFKASDKRINISVPGRCRLDFHLLCCLMLRGF